MPTSKDLKDLDSQLKKTVISAESFKRGSSFDLSKNLVNIHKNIGSLAGHTRKLAVRFINLEKVVDNNSRKIAILKNLSRSQSKRASGDNIGAKLPGGTTSNVEDSISAIAKSVSSIAEIMAGRKKLADNTAAYERRKAEQEKRGLAESKLEKVFKGIAKTAEKVIAPVKSLLDRILDFIGTVILGRIVYKIVEWMGDPKNASKVKSIIRFVKDWWPALIGSYILFGTTFGRFIRGMTGMLGRFIFQVGKVAIPQLLRFIKTPFGAGALLFGAGAAIPAMFPGTVDEQERKTKAQSGTTEDKIRSLEQQKASLNLFQKMQGVGSEIDEQLYSLKTGKTKAYAGGGFVNGFVSGEKGVDKIPAMLSDGEFVMSVGAVQKYGVDTLESMNAAGGGTNRPKIIGGTTYAAGGGSIGSYVNPDPSYKDPILDKRLNLMKSLQDYTSAKISESGDSKLISALNNLTNVMNNTSTPSSGGGVTGYLMRAQKEAQKKVLGGGTSVSGGGGTGGYPAISRARGYLGRVGGEINKKLFGGSEKKKRESGPVDFGKMTSDMGGVLQTIQGIAGAAEEAIPALMGGIVGINRTDTKISDDMQRALLAAKKTAAERGRDYVDYKDYAENAGGMAASLTMGRIGNSEWKRDSKGRIIGLRQVYDTNRSAKEAMQQANDSFMDFVKTGSPKSLMRAIYKPGEALLAKVQERGTTTHDVNFSEKVLGFKSEAVKNQEALEEKRPWWDKMGWFGGATGKMQRDKKYYGPGGDPSGSGRGQARQAKVAKTKPKVKPVAPPTAPKPKVVSVPSPKSENRRGGTKTKTKTPNFGATCPKNGNQKKKILGIF